jgi:hypothetical protein
MVHAARTHLSRDDLTEMFCKRMAAITKRAKAELEEIRVRQLEMSERLITHYRDLLKHLDPAARRATTWPPCHNAGQVHRRLDE